MDYMRIHLRSALPPSWHGIRSDSTSLIIVWLSFLKITLSENSYLNKDITSKNDPCHIIFQLARLKRNNNKQ